MLDHLVYAVGDLEAAMADFEKRSGVKPSYGGQHVGLGTHNAVFDIGEGAYVELLAPDPTQPESKGPLPFGIDASAEPRLVTWAAKASQLGDRVAAARAAGFDPGEVTAISRRLPDGGLLEWELTSRDGPPGGDGLIPYLIDWGAVPHPTTRATAGCQLTEFRGEHPDPDAVLQMLDALGVELPLRQADSAALVAVIETPRGVLTLR